VRDAVTVSVGEFPDARRTGDVNGSVVPETALREHYFVGKHDRFVEPSVAVCVFQTHDVVRWVRKLLVGLLVRAGGICDVEPALVIETGADRPLHQRWAGDELDLKAVGNSERLRGEFELRREGNGSNQADCDGGAQGKRVHALLIPSKRQERQQENWIEGCRGRFLTLLPLHGCSPSPREGRAGRGTGRGAVRTELSDFPSP